VVWFKSLCVLCVLCVLGVLDAYVGVCGYVCVSVCVYVCVLCVLGVLDACRAQAEPALALRQRGTVVHLADAVVSSALLQLETSGGGVRDDVASDGLGVVLGEAHAVGVGYYLVRDHLCGQCENGIKR
jgi:hypothetical protein